MTSSLKLGLHLPAITFGLSLCAGAQIALLTQPGSYYRAYYTTSAVDVSNLIGQPGGPHRWDFSYAKTSVESIQRLDVVAPNDASHGASFPDAAYADRLTNESTSARSWSYYRTDTNQGRIYYGFYDAVANAECTYKIFDPPTTDLPACITNGRSWSRVVDFSDCIDAGFIVLDLAVHFTSHANADAYGTVVLPGIGEVPALRVNEVNTYEITDLTLGIPIPTQHFRNYYWLVRGIGKAVHIISPGQPTVPPPNFPTSRTFTRVFEVRPWAAANLRILHQGTQAMLSWRHETNTSGYRIESRDGLKTITPWQFLSETTNPSWPGAFTGDARFFRVTIKP